MGMPAKRRYVALLRAVNVGGSGIVKMADLRRSFEAFGLEDVTTYIQSGNVIFSTARAGVGPLTRELEDHLEADLKAAIYSRYGPPDVLAPRARAPRARGSGCTGPTLHAPLKAPLPARPATRRPGDRESPSVLLLSLQRLARRAYQLGEGSTATPGRAGILGSVGRGASRKAPRAVSAGAVRMAGWRRYPFRRRLPGRRAGAAGSG